MKISTEVVEGIIAFLWLVFAAIALKVFHRPIGDLLKKLGGVKAMGVELSFVESSMNHAIIELAEKYQESKVRVSASDRRHVLKRVEENLDMFRDAEILWVDDLPENNNNERRMFRQLKVEIDIATSNESALKILDRKGYDIVFSDMDRGGVKTAGIDFLSQFREMDSTTPVIFYIDKLDRERGTPKGAFGITNRPDVLLNLVLDALEGRKYEKV